MTQTNAQHKCLRNDGAQCKINVVSSFNVWLREIVKRFKVKPLRKHRH